MDKEKIIIFMTALLFILAIWIGTTIIFIKQGIGRDENRSQVPKHIVGISSLFWSQWDMGMYEDNIKMREEMQKIEENRVRMQQQADTSGIQNKKIEAASSALAPIASIEGYVFIDVNKNKIFDGNIDILYSNVIVRLRDEDILNEKRNLNAAIVSTAQIKNGYYRMDVPRTGKLRIDLESVSGSGVGFIESSGVCSGANNTFPDVFNGGEKVKDCNFIVDFD